MAIAATACGRSSLDEDEPDGARDSAYEDVSLDGTELDGSSGLDGALDGSTGVDGGTPNPCGAGYCMSNGKCVPNGNDTCGNFGDLCESCDVDAGYFCKGSCYRPQPNCDQDNCHGCCASTAYCATGVHDIACGHNGLPCDRCVPSEGTGQCVPRANGGGTCINDAGCGPSNCNGCCVGNICAVGTQEFACGKDGVACENCTFFFKETCIARQCTKGP
jgi:hypothetical protein